jgi:hypothetical protein
MKWLIEWKTFEELRYKDISTITGEFSDYFSVSFEFEIETDDRLAVKIDFSEYDEDSVEEVISIVKSDLKIRLRSDISLLKKTAWEFLDLVQFGNPNLDKFNQFFTQKSSGLSPEQTSIVSQLKSVISSYILIEDLHLLKKKVSEHLPKFASKWGNILDFVGDPSLERGIEIKPKTYLRGLNSGIEMLQDFFTDFNSQDFWKFTPRTGLHINVGTLKPADWNPIKGLVFLNDFNESGDIPLVFKDIDWRLTNKFCGSMISKINQMSKEKKEFIRKSINLGDISETERVLNNFLNLSIKEWGVKNLGFNISKIESGYVEFRYVGGQVSLEVIIGKLKYFALIVYLMTNREYKRKEYLTKLYKFIDSNF